MCSGSTFHADAFVSHRYARLAVHGRLLLVGADTWQDQRLLITAVDVATGEPVVWGHAGGVPFVHAVETSSVFPGVEPPVAVQGRRLTWADRRSPMSGRGVP